jgi:hypothetical protein
MSINCVAAAGASLGASSERRTDKLIRRGVADNPVLPSTTEMTPHVCAPNFLPADQ